MKPAGERSVVNETMTNGAGTNGARMDGTKGTKRWLTDRVERLSRPDELHDVLRRYGGKAMAGDDAWRPRVVQLDGTGAATVELCRDHGANIFAKLYPDGSGIDVHDKLVKLRGEGFGDDSRYQVVEPLGYVPEYDLLLAWQAPGVAVADHIGTEGPELLDGVVEAGRWLGRLHSSPLKIGPPQSLLDAGELLPLARRLAKTISKHPDHLGLALEMVATLEDLAADTVDGRFAQSAGQCRPIHVFVSDSAVTVIDLDRSRPCDPARDVAEFVHRLRMTSFSRTDSKEAAEGPTRAFLAAYLEVADPANLANLSFHWARYVFHSLNRKLKDVAGAKREQVIAFYTSEFDTAVSRRHQSELGRA